MSEASVAVTIYCERAGDAFWAEPLNALTNLAFLLAAGSLVRTLLRETPSRRYDPRFLPAMPRCLRI